MMRDRLLKLSRGKAAEGGFTLVELMIASSIYIGVTAGLLTGFTSLLRNYEAVKQYSTHHADEMRISDYLALDFRRALAVPAVAQNSVTIEIPSYSQNPTLNQGKIRYGSSNIIVRYYLSNDGSIYRQEDSNPAVKVADNVADFIFLATPYDLGKVIKTTITFKPIFRSTGAPRDPTTFHNRILLRNKIY